MEQRLTELKLEQERSQLKFYSDYSKLNDQLMLSNKDSVNTWYSEYKDYPMNARVPVDVVLMDKLIIMATQYGLYNLVAKLERVKKQKTILVKDILRLRIDTNNEISYAERIHNLGNFLEESYVDSYNSMMWIAQTSEGMGWTYDIPEIDILKPWGEENVNFADRLSQRMYSLTENIMVLVLSGIAAGWTINTITELMDSKFSTSVYSNKSIVINESTYFVEKAKFDCQKSIYFRYRFSAILDAVTSKICRSLNGSIFKFSEAVIGINYPPMHRYCRSIAIPIDNMKVPAYALAIAGNMSREEFLSKYSP